VFAVAPLLRASDVLGGGSTQIGREAVLPVLDTWRNPLGCRPALVKLVAVALVTNGIAD
jgi:hypothetical protein